MALQQARVSQAIVCIRLKQIPSLPTTEDLLYVLAIATQNKKPAEIPFTNPYNSVQFVIRVAPATRQLAPRWTFERCDGEGIIQLWTRESSEVIMIQGKIKIEANYTGAASADEAGVEAQKSSESQPIIMGSPAISATNLPFMGMMQDQAEGAPAATASETQKRGKGSTWLFSDGNSGPVGMPPPVALGSNVVNNYLFALLNPATGLTRHSAFEFFLLRDFEYVRNYGGKMSLAVFDFVNVETRERADLPGAATAALADILNDWCTPLEVCTQLKSGEFAILLCGYDGEKALKFAQQLWDRLLKHSFDLTVCSDPRALAIGVACIPETCKEPGVLIAAAIKAKDLARESQCHYMLFPLF